MQLCAGSTPHDRGVQTLWDKLGADVQNRIPILIESVNNLLTESKLMRAIEDWPVVEKITGREKYESQDQTAQDVILQGPSTIRPKNSFVQSGEQGFPHSQM